MKLLYSFKKFKKFKSIQVTKAFFFLYISETDVKMKKETQRTRQCNKTFKMVAKAEVDLN